MANLRMIGSVDSSLDGLIFTGLTFPANATAETTQVYRSARSLKINTNNPAVAVEVESAYTCFDDAGNGLTVWFMFETLPAADTPILEGRTSGSTAVWRIHLKTDGTLRFNPIGATTVDGTTVLEAGRWYQIGLSYTITLADDFRFDMFVNSDLQGSATAGTMTNIGATKIRFRGVGASAGTNRVYWWNHLVVDDRTDYTFPGYRFTTAKMPAANNVNQFDTPIVSNPANRWENVNERPLSVTNGWLHGAASAVRENYTLQTASQGDIDITGMHLIGHLGWVWAKSDAAATGTPKIIINNVETAITLATIASRHAIVVDSTSYPSHAAGIGMLSSDATPTYLYECGVVIAYYATRPWFLSEGI